ncbi:hypothetical protein TraAM80_04146 [Trypanosoma rangeli]|uniref:DUF155 domain-containing protein n=1 Tax=Trypanosoma rangeli TaxID=5698 RepID=A0A3S5IRE7_TRYRA|nr:uncharacterized protein TraAM80_04146 [Trypanosoma rangeli]RNF06270.1 hypothetical protein TraAM80_04146 [Trypanosoma rangeli]|eukprot:RNF06270.1 hypothetical protein TraAM80_04146 [Trypanosoma rangeli]
MADSESDVRAVQLCNRLVELLYSSSAVFTVSQIALILGVDEARVVHELKRSNFRDIVYDKEEGTVQMRGHRRTPPSETTVGGGMLTSRIMRRDSSFFESQHAKYGSDGYNRSMVSTRGGGRVVSTKSALRKTKYRRPFTADAVSVDNMENTSPVGRVGYVCVADEFNLSGLEAYYRAQGYYTKFDFDVLHIRFSDKEMGSRIPRKAAVHATRSQAATSNPTASGGTCGTRTADSNNNENNGNNNNNNINNGGEKAVDRSSMLVAKNPRKAGFDLFVFEYGAIVWWGFEQRYFKIVENDFMLPNSAIAEFMENRYMTQLVSENYPVWCTYTLERKETLEPDEHFRERLRFDHFIIPFGRGDMDTGNVSMLCASHALAQSAKIDYLELKVQELAENCSPLPRDLREKGQVSITERRLLQLRGEVLSYRLMLKSGSNLMDEPDFFWENAYLKPVFQATKECFEISERVEALDNKLDAANEILSILAEEFSQRHGARLEWIVIWLVLAEVVIGVLELVINVKPWFYRRV